MNNNELNIPPGNCSAENAVENAIRLMESLLARKRYIITVDEQGEMRYQLPYYLEKIGSSETRILLNRNYKPVGNTMNSGEPRVSYEDFTNLHVHLTEDQISELTCLDGYFFRNENAPWESKKDALAYLDRLRVFQRARTA